MFDIFDQPWTLVAAAVLTLFGIFTFRSFFPEKRYWWQFLIPVFIAASAFGLDLLVKTDLEKINALIDTGIKAVEEENCNAIDEIISTDYHDSFHNTKQDLMAHCYKELSQPLVEKNKKLALQLRITLPTADAILTALARFEKDSFVTRDYKQFLMVKVRLYLKKQPDKKWLINRTELLEIDRQPVNWQQIR